MEDKLIELLESFGYPVILQGSLGQDDDYPSAFFTFWQNDSSDGSHYDNDARSEIFDYDVNLYADNPSLVYSKLKEAKQLLKENNFIISGSGYSVVSDELTHTGRGMNVLYRQN